MEAQTKEALSALLPALSSSAPQVGGGVAPRGPRCLEGVSLGPILRMWLQSYTEWLQELREKGPELLKQPPASAEPSSVSMAALSAPPSPPIAGATAVSFAVPWPECPELSPWAVGRNLCVWLTRTLSAPRTWPPS